MAGMDETMAKIIRPVDYRSNAGTMARGKNVYPGGVNNAVSGPRTLKKKGNERPALLDNPEGILAYMKKRVLRGN